MTATCELRMPSSYFLMDEDEMEYVEGGAKWTVRTLWGNIQGICNAYGLIKSFCKNFYVNGRSVWTWACAYVAWSEYTAKIYLASFCAKFGLKVAAVSRVAGVIVGLSAAAMIYYLGTHKVFY